MSQTTVTVQVNADHTYTVCAPIGTTVNVCFNDLVNKKEEQLSTDRNENVTPEFIGLEALMSSPFVAQSQVVPSNKTKRSPTNYNVNVQDFIKNIHITKGELIDIDNIIAVTQKPSSLRCTNNTLMPDYMWKKYVRCLCILGLASPFCILGSYTAESKMDVMINTVLYADADEIIECAYPRKQKSIKNLLMVAEKCKQYALIRDRIIKPVSVYTCLATAVNHIIFTLSQVEPGQDGHSILVHTYGAQRTLVDAVYLVYTNFHKINNQHVHIVSSNLRYIVPAIVEKYNQYGDVPLDEMERFTIHVYKHIVHMVRLAMIEMGTLKQQQNNDSMITVS